LVIFFVVKVTRDRQARYQNLISSLCFHIWILSVDIDDILTLSICHGANVCSNVELILFIHWWHITTITTYNRTLLNFRLYHITHQVYLVLVASKSFVLRSGQELIVGMGVVWAIVKYLNLIPILKFNRRLLLLYFYLIFLIVHIFLNFPLVINLFHCWLDWYVELIMNFNQLHLFLFNFVRSDLQIQRRYDNWLPGDLWYHYLVVRIFDLILLPILIFDINILIWTSTAQRNLLGVNVFIS